MSMPTTTLLFPRFNPSVRPQGGGGRDIKVKASDVVKPEQRGHPTAPIGAMRCLGLQSPIGGQQNLVQAQGLNHEAHPVEGLGRARCEYAEDLAPPIGHSRDQPQEMFSLPNPM